MIKSLPWIFHRHACVQSSFGFIFYTFTFCTVSSNKIFFKFRYRFRYNLQPILCVDCVYAGMQYRGFLEGRGQTYPTAKKKEGGGAFKIYFILFFYYANSRKICLILYAWCYHLFTQLKRKKDGYMPIIVVLQPKMMHCACVKHTLFSRSGGSKDFFYLLMDLGV